MQHFQSVKDANPISDLVQKALFFKSNPFHKSIGENKTLGLIFLNPSLRTRLSTQIAAQNLGMNVIVMNIDKEGWSLETREGAIMNGTSVEHIKDAAAVMGSYCHIIGIRSFALLKNKEEDYAESIFEQFKQYAQVPILSLESATLHPLQSLADLVTIHENLPHKRTPKIVLTWAPHIKPIPQAVANSFAEWILAAGFPLTIAHPEGYELSEQFVKGATITHQQNEAFEDADFIYVKNWSSYSDYGKVLTNAEDWMPQEVKLQNNPKARIMHCLPVRRNVELADDLLDSARSLVIQQATNRIWAAQAVLAELLKN
jgi:N-succinyl-L-ornithine transcarbamylase